jgi:hypothetical protein
VRGLSCIAQQQHVLALNILKITHNLSAATALAVNGARDHHCDMRTMWIYTWGLHCRCVCVVLGHTAGVCALFWGTASDRYGRRPILLLSTVMLLGFTVGCYFSSTIGVLILFRGLQGAAGKAAGNCKVYDTGPCKYQAILPLCSTRACLSHLPNKMI